MSWQNRLKQPLKQARWGLRRAQAARRWGAELAQRVPAVVGNAMPKSGSHLLIQILNGLTELGPFIDPGMPPLSRSADNHNLPEAEVVANLRKLRPGDIAYCYLHARAPYLQELTRPGIAPFFVYRDPRDVIVSQVFYATDMHSGHGMHTYYNEALTNVEERIQAAILGVQTETAQLSPIAQKYAHYLGWLVQPAVCSLRFEDLILNREVALGRALDHLQQHGFTAQVSRQQAIETLAAAVQPRASGTFRKGQPGEWREHFSAANKQTFKETTGDLLQRLGYEQDQNW